MLPDLPASGAAWQAAQRSLVYSDEFAELTTEDAARSKIGYGEISKGTVFGKRAKVAVKTAGAVIDNYNPSQSVFLTGTLPGSTLEAVAALAAWSAWCVKTLRQWLRDTFPGARHLGVWEYQRRGALHLHMVVLCNDSVQAQELIAKWKARWIKLLVSVGKRAGVDMFGRADGTTWAGSKEVTRVDAQLVKKSVKHYLAKYLSKGSDTIRGAATYPPSRWWFCDRSLLQEGKGLHQSLTLVDLSLPAALQLFEMLGSQLAERSQKIYPYYSPVNLFVRGVIGCGDNLDALRVFDTLKNTISSISAFCAVFGDRVVNTTQVYRYFRGPGTKVFG